MTNGSTPPAAAPVLLSLPAAHFLGRDSSIRIRAFNSATGVVLTIGGYLLRPDGTLGDFTFTHTPNTDRTVTTQTYAVGEGQIQHVTVFASSGTPRRGQCYVIIESLRGFTGSTIATGLLVKGYVTDTTALGYPGALLEDSPAGRGVMRSITGTDPAANTEISETVPTNARWRFIGLAATFVADANPANRVIVLVFDDGTNIYLRAPAAGNVTAGQTVQVSAGAFGHTANSFTQVWPSVTVPDLILMGGHRVRTITSGIQVGDNYSAPQMLVEEWIED